MTRRPIRIAGAALAASGAALLAFTAPAATAAVLADVVYLVGAPLDAGAVAQFGTASKADATMAALPSMWTPSVATGAPTAAEIVGEAGWAIAHTDDFDYALQGWDVASGAFLSTVAITIGGSPVIIPPGPGGYEQVTVFGLDSVGDVLQTGVCLTTVDDDESTAGGCYLGTLGTDGLFTATVDLDPEVIPTSIATDPLTGTTYVFLVNDDGYSSAIVVSGGAVVGWIDLVGLESAVMSPNFPLGADFDRAGVLWIVAGINNLEEYHLFSYPAGSSIETTEPADIGALVYGTALNFVSSAALTVGEPAAPLLPGTGSTGSATGSVAIGTIGGMMLVGGAIALAATRRRAA